MRFTVHRRTFEASGHPKGSPERAQLNESALTSEYMPSYRYAVMDREHPRQTQTYRTKRAAQFFADAQNERRA